MYHNNTLSTIRATARLSPQQHYEFTRMANIYAISADLCISIWADISRQYRYGFNRNASVKVSRVFEQEILLKEVPEEDIWISNCALKDTLRQLRECSCFSAKSPELPTPRNSLRMYRGFDVKVTKGYALIPGIGTIGIGRFPSFRGRIVATGLEIFDGDVHCVILYEQPTSENTKTINQ